MMSSINFVILLVLAFLIRPEGNEISSQMQCVDEHCTVPISMATGLVNYFGGQKGRISFVPGDKLTIYSKQIAPNQDLWGAEVNGKKGFVPKKMVKEYKIIHPAEELRIVSRKLPEKLTSGKIENSERHTVDEKEAMTAKPSGEMPSTPESYEVVDGTTITSDPLLMATPTVSSIGVDSKEGKTSPIEATTPFIATPVDINTQSAFQSEMFPISPTAMIKKSEMTESTTSAGDIVLEPENPNVVDTVLNLMSGFVSGKVDGDPKSDTPLHSETHGNEEVLPTDKASNGHSINGSEILGDDVKIGQEHNVNEETEQLYEVNDNKENIKDNADEDEEEEDDDDDEEEEDGEYEEDEEYTEEEVGDTINEVSAHKEHEADLANEDQSSSVHSIEKNIELVESRVTESHSKVTKGFGDESDKHVEVKSSTIHDLPGETQFEALNETEAASHVPSSSSDRFIGLVAANGVNLGESAGNSETLPSSLDVTPSIGKESEVKLVSAEEEVYKTSDLVSPGTKSADDVSLQGGTLENTMGSIESTTGHVLQRDLAAVQHQQEESDEKISQDEMKRNDEATKMEEMNTSKNYEEIHTESTVAPPSSFLHHEENTFPPNPGNDELNVDVNEGNSTISAELPYLEQTTVNPISDGSVSENDIKMTSPSHEAVEEQVTFDKNLPLENVPFNNIEINNVDVGQQPATQIEKNQFGLEEKSDQEKKEQGTSDKNLQLENVLLKNVENNQVEVEQQPVTQIGNDKFELEGKSDQEKKNVDEMLNVFNDDSNLPVSQENSGILSMIFSPLSSGYEFLADMIFGTGDEVEVITDSERIVDIIKKSDESESTLKQSIDDQDNGNAAGQHIYFGSTSNAHCEANPTDSYCKNWPSDLPSVSETSAEGQESKNCVDTAIHYNPFDINNPSYYGFLCYSIASGLVLVFFFLGHYYLEWKKRDVFLLAKLNIREKQLMVSSTECLILKNKLKDADDSTDIIESLRSELEKVQNEKAQLEKELEVAAEAGLEMELMVSQCLSSQQDSKSLMESIEQLQLQANQQQTKTSTLENNLILKTQENENLYQELNGAAQKVLELNNELKKVQADLIQKEKEHNEQYDELRKLYDNQKKQYEEDLRNKTVESVMALTKCNSLEVTLTETKDALAVKVNEIAVLQECLEMLKTSNGEEPEKAAIQVKDMLDFGKLKTELIDITKERDTLKEELQGEEEARKLLEDHVKVIKEEVEKLRKCHEAAERDKAEAQTRLEVLSSYFKEKETQLQKELGAQVQKYTDASSVMQHMKSLEEEVENYRKELSHSEPQVVEQISDDPIQDIIDATPEEEGSQNETLKKEILDQERGYKSQLSTIEKKARENWVAARQAERKLEESKQEAGQLRNRLTMLSKSNPQSVSQNGDDSKQNMSVMDSNGEMSASPLHMGLASNSSMDSLFLDPNSSPPLVAGGGRLPPLLPPPPFPPLPPLPPRSPYHHPLSPALSFVPPPPPDEALYPPSVDGHRPPPLGRMSSPPPPPSPSRSPHLPPTNSRPGKYPSPFHDRKGGRRSTSPPADMYRGMPIDDRGLMDEWGMGRYRTPPPHATHLSDYPPFLYPHPQPLWEDETMPPTSSFKPLPSQAEALREKKGGKSKDNHPTESGKIDKPNRHGGKQ